MNIKEVNIENVNSSDLTLLLIFNKKIKVNITLQKVYLNQNEINDFLLKEMNDKTLRIEKLEKENLEMKSLLEKINNTQTKNPAKNQEIKELKNINPPEKKNNNNDNVSNKAIINISTYSESYEGKKKEQNNNYEENSIIIDVGSEFYKAGFSGEEGPRIIMESVIAEPKTKPSYIDLNTNNFYIGTEAISKRGILKLNYPIRDTIKDWDFYEKILEHIFVKDLKIDPSKFNVLLSKSSFYTKNDTKKLAQIMFEKFKVKGLIIKKSSELSLCAFGKFNGISVNSGYLTISTPIINLKEISNATMKLNIGGNELTNYTAKLLKEIGINFTTRAEMEIVNDIKKKLYYVALDPNKEKKVPIEYELPDGRFITIEGSQRFRVFEALFYPQLIGKNEDGLHKIIYNSIENSPKNYKKDLYSNICLSGGNLMFRGTQERVDKEIKNLIQKNENLKIKVFKATEYPICWIGGSIYASISTTSFVSKKEYQEDSF